jgi:hypothetical protein
MIQSLVFSYLFASSHFASQDANQDNNEYQGQAREKDQDGQAQGHFTEPRGREMGRSSHKRHGLSLDPSTLWMDSLCGCPERHACYKVVAPHLHCVTFTFEETR